MSLLSLAFMPRTGQGRPPGPARSPFPFFALLLGAAALLPPLLPPLNGILQYDRAAVAAGEVWRVVTGHWTHWGWEHLFWDVGVFVILGAVCERRSRTHFLWTVIAGSLIVSLTVWAALPQMLHYRGLSGLDAALYLLAAVMVAGDSRTNKSAEAVMVTVLLVAAFCAKIGYEAVSGSAFFVRDMGGVVPVPAAHIAGAAVGAIAAFASISGGRRNACSR